MDPPKNPMSAGVRANQSSDGGRGHRLGIWKFCQMAPIPKGVPNAIVTGTGPFVGGKSEKIAEWAFTTRRRKPRIHRITRMCSAHLFWVMRCVCATGDRDGRSHPLTSSRAAASCSHFGRLRLVFPPVSLASSADFSSDFHIPARSTSEGNQRGIPRSRFGLMSPQKKFRHE